MEDINKMKDQILTTAMEISTMLNGKTVKEALALKQRQNNTTEYCLRINGKPIKYFDLIGADEIAEWLECADNNPESYVDLSLVRTEILFSPHRYYAMKKHFDQSAQQKQGE